MRVLVCAVGRLKAGPERDLEARYVERARALGRGLSLAPVEVSEIAESAARRPADRMADEAKRLADMIPEGAATVALDERGRALASGEFAQRLAAWRDEGRPAVALLIGGADGLDTPLRGRADLVLSLGAMTWPHQIVRILLAEQIYRAMTILSGHPYHRA